MKFGKEKPHSYIEGFFETIYYKNKEINKRRKIIKYTEEDLIEYFKVESKEKIELFKFLISKIKVEFCDGNGKTIKVKLILEEKKNS